MPLNIVLIEPEIPNNTGNIGRLALATGSRLHLVKPLGFDLSNKRLQRAGLDYWQHLSPKIYNSAQDFFDQHTGQPMAYFSSQATTNFWEIKFSEDLFLIFGKESVGLPKEITRSNVNRLYRIPLYSEHIRSLNLANAVGIVVYEGLRQLS